MRSLVPEQPLEADQNPLGATQSIREKLRVGLDRLRALLPLDETGRDALDSRRREQPGKLVKQRGLVALEIGPDRGDRERGDNPRLSGRRELGDRLPGLD